MAPRILIFSIVLNAEYLFYVKSIATYSPTFFGYIISVLASVNFSNILHIFVGKGLDVLQSKIKPFEEYLAGLLKKPFLKESDILFTFLTSNDEFTMASSTLGVGKIINKVNPMKLTTKERGQSLQPFIDNFVSSTLSSPSKPRLLKFFSD